jgi:homoserine dehydrogenase
MGPIYCGAEENMAHKVALIGFGNVGQGFCEILQLKGEFLRQKLGFAAQIVAVCTLRRGSLYHPAGLDPATLLAVSRDNGHLAAYPDRPGLERGWDAGQIIAESNADTIVEISYTDLESGQPAIDYCRAAFAAGKNVVTANKGPLALAYAELAGLAKARGVHWGFEGTVMSGTPALGLALAGLAGAEIREIRGILNGTTNYILSKMEAGQSYDAALQQAQALGYAEADPTADVDGHDAASKVVILANVIMGVPLGKAEVTCQGISHLTLADIERAKAEGKRWKLIGRVSQGGGWIKAGVAPEMVPLTDPLAAVMDATNAITYETNLLGPVTLIGAGAGRVETGFALLSDLINIERGRG